ncbi:uncharacterized protein LOC110820695 [Carica papaya]|uniref:uncharacterized protein LOC110820695 n=1 Tax=Carica papaya TaxID=3649 RepID=UPI000B8CEDFB|nr:uncharacterized protein LOC110820695 [Carica papaya]
MEHHHFSHEHPLTFFEGQNTNSDAKNTKCSGCLDPVLKESSYGCTQCHYFLHERCAELPGKISHPIHPRHPLFLRPNGFEADCVLCRRSGQSLIYYCSPCVFSVDIKCTEVLPPVIQSQTHEHPFSLLCKQVSFVCDACDKRGSHSPYVCFSCNLTVHHHCTSLPRTIKTIRHEHLLRHTYVLHESESDCSRCSICKNFLSADRGCYHCPACDYSAHVHCATRSELWDVTTRDEEDDDTEGSEARLDSIIRIVKEIKLGEDMIAAEIEHFSHEHPLIFSNEGKDNKCCDGCGIPISSPFYSCEGCDFFLHKTCADLPRNKLYPFHPHALTLLPKSSHSSRVFACNICSIYSNGFSYNCEKCSFDLDLRCSSIPDTLIHQAHKHSLFVIVQDDVEWKCCGCGALEKRGLGCPQCFHFLDFKCATLPLTAMHSYDDHPLKLTFQDDSDQLYCDVCEDTRDPKHWFYSCDDCGVTIHPECVFGKYPYIKVGDTYTIDSHPHSLRFVKKTEKYPSCNSCGQPCTDLALECAESECGLIVHWECVALNKC